MKSKRVMIPRTELVLHPLDNWQNLLRNGISDIKELLRITGNLEHYQTNPDNQCTQPIAQGFPLLVPQPYVERIRYGDPHDPLLLQVLPQRREYDYTPGYNQDPLEEAPRNVQPGLIHKYHGRILIVASGACAINCRYCFRRHFPYQENRFGSTQWQQVLDYIRQDRGISEVIFSGGDPLINNDKRLSHWLSDLAMLPQIKRVRIHTRLPVVIPQRVGNELLSALTGTRLKPVIVLHANHAQELDEKVAGACQRLNQGGITLLNQSVLLRGINDRAGLLIELSERLFDMGVMPYYLHLPDKVQGAAHFDIEPRQARRLAGLMAAKLPGYLVPRLVQEQAGRPAKTLLLPEFA